MDYTTLRTKIQSWTENDALEFTAELDQIILLAEQRIAQESNLIIFRKKSTVSFSSGITFITAPTGMIEPRWVRIQGGKPLRQKDEAFLLEFSATSATPRFYAWGSNARTQIELAPLPNANGTIELGYTYLPESIITATNTWLGDNAENLLFYACLLEATLFMKEEPQEKSGWIEMYQRSLSAVQNQDESDSLTDKFTVGDTRLQKSP